MWGAVDFQAIENRLYQHSFSPWGPDGLRYVCILIWNNDGFRHLYNHFSADDWNRWHMSSGEIWDLFLAGCYSIGDANTHHTRSLVLSTGERKFFWNAEKSDELAGEVQRRAARHASAEPWSFTGPMEIVAIGARRVAEDVVLDWASLRSATIDVRRIPEAVTAYTLSHSNLDPGEIPDDLPAPGDFHDANPPAEILRDIGRRLGPFWRFLFSH